MTPPMADFALLDYPHSSWKGVTYGWPMYVVPVIAQHNGMTSCYYGCPPGTTRSCLCRRSVTTHSLYDLSRMEESARTLGVLDVNQ